MLAIVRTGLRASASLLEIVRASMLSPWGVIETKVAYAIMRDHETSIDWEVNHGSYVGLGRTCQ